MLPLLCPSQLVPKRNRVPAICFALLGPRLLSHVIAPWWFYPGPPQNHLLWGQRGRLSAPSEAQAWRWTSLPKPPKRKPSLSLSFVVGFHFFLCMVLCFHCCGFASVQISQVVLTQRTYKLTRMEKSTWFIHSVSLLREAPLCSEGWVWVGRRVSFYQAANLAMLEVF